MPEVLRIADLRAGYASLPVLHGLSFAVEDGAFAVILGPNGVGKTTMMRVVSGLMRPWSGWVSFDDEDITGLEPGALVRRGIAMVPGPPGVFRDLTVTDNLRVGSFGLPGRGSDGVLDRALGTFPILAERRDQIAGSLSGGEQRMLAIARAMMSEPRLLLVDEASMGLSPAMVRQTFSLLAEVRARGVTVVMVEQNVAALDVADHALVMERGRVVREAHGSDIAGMRQEVARAYLGGEPALNGGRR